LQEVFGMKNDDIFRAASGFGGGMGMMADTCGALVGASMMLSLEFGRKRDELENIEALDKSGVPVAELYKWFQAEFGSVKCRDIRTDFGGGTFHDFTIPGQLELAEKAGIFKKCSDLVGKAAAKTAEMLWDSLKEKGKAKK
jgi:C_GCAxxG_C_C family probable redox protein